MRPIVCLFPRVAAFAFVSFSAPEALSHIDLLEPEARAHGTAARGDTEVDSNSNLKQGPCGQIATGRTERVATYTAGETITVRVREENAHVSYLRVSIDLDGDDFPLRVEVPAAPETQEEAAAAEAALNADGLLAVYREDNDTAGFVHELAVTLPRASCESCTLQVLQHMYDDPAAPYYFQCADLVIVEAGESPDAGGENEDGSVPPRDAAGAGTPLGGNSAMTPLTTGGTPTDGSARPPGVGDTTASGSPSENASSPSPAAAASSRGGCSLARGARALLPGPALAALALAFTGVCRLARRERRRRRSAGVADRRSFDRRPDSR
jgi:hypothetical protein